MTHQVTIRNTATVSGQDDSTILQSALDAGLVLPYGLPRRRLRQLQGKVVDGRIDYGRYSEKALTRAAERAQATRSSPGEAPVGRAIEAREVRKAGDILVRKLPRACRSWSAPRDDAMIVYLKLPANER